MATATAQTDRRANGLAIQANADAVTKLKEAHAEEFGGYLREARTARGLSAEAGGESTKKIEARLAAQMAKVEKLKEQLAQRGVSVEES